QNPSDQNVPSQPPRLRPVNQNTTPKGILFMGTWPRPPLPDANHLKQTGWIVRLETLRDHQFRGREIKPDMVQTSFTKVENRHETDYRWYSHVHTSACRACGGCSCAHRGIEGAGCRQNDHVVGCQ